MKLHQFDFFQAENFLMNPDIKILLQRAALFPEDVPERPWLTSLAVDPSCRSNRLPRPATTRPTGWASAQIERIAASAEAGAVNSCS